MVHLTRNTLRLVPTPCKQENPLLTWVNEQKRRVILPSLMAPCVSKIESLRNVFRRLCGGVEKPLVKEEEAGKACLESADSGRIAPAMSRLSLLMEMLTLLLPIGSTARVGERETGGWA